MTTARIANPPLAIALILCATAFMAGTTLLAKALGTDAIGPALHPLQISQGRFMFALLVFSTAATILRPTIARPDLKLHFARTLFGWGGVSLMFAAASFIPLADATAISFLNPVFAMMLAIAFLGERVGRIRWAAAAIALAGAMILIRPGPSTFQPAALLALAAAMVMGMEITLIKRLSGREAPFQILLINNAIGFSISTLAVLAVWQMPTPGQWAALVGVGCVMASAQVFFIHAMARADASLVVPFTYSALIFATLYDLAVFGVVPDAVSILGAGVILTGAGLLAAREIQLGRQARRRLPTSTGQ